MAETASAGGCHLGIDLGGTEIKAVALSMSGGILAQGRASTPRTGVRAVIAAMHGLAARVAGGVPIQGAGVAVPGVVDMGRGLVKFLPNVPGVWANVPLVEELGRLLGVGCVLLNDGRAATYGELCLGAGRGCRDFVLLAVGTGIGGGVVVDGELLLGSGGHAGEVGHQVIDMHGPRCACGGWGCAESLASGPALVAAAVRAVVQGMDTGLHAACGGDVGRITPSLVAEVAGAGDPVASELLEEVAHRLGTAVGNLVVVLNPERVVIGGGLSLAGERLLTGIRSTMAERIGWYLRHAPVEVVAAELGVNAGALGAAAWARRLAVGRSALGEGLGL